MGYNKVLLLGNLTRDPEIRQLPNSDTSVCSLGLAVNRKYRSRDGEQREEVLFIDCDAFGRTAEVLAEHMSKGKPVLIEGRLKLDQWQDKNGESRQKIKVAVESFQFVGDGSRGSADSNKHQDKPTGNYAKGGRPRASKSAAVPSAYEAIDEDSIPFE